MYAVCKTIAACGLHGDCNAAESDAVEDDGVNVIKSWVSVLRCASALGTKDFDCASVWIRLSGLLCDDNEGRIA